MSDDQARKRWESKRTSRLSKGDRAFRFLMRLFWLGVWVCVILVVSWTWLSGIDAMQSGLWAAKPYFAVWRVLLFVILIGGWHYWIGLLARWADLDEAGYRYALAQRWRTAVWLLVIEAILVQGLAGRLLRQWLVWD